MLPVRAPITAPSLVLPMLLALLALAPTWAEATAPVATATPAAIVGRSVEGRPIRVWHAGDRPGRPRLLVVGCIHGEECAGTDVTRLLRTQPVAAGPDLWVVDDVNPDGRARATRQNARGVDLNRNWGAMWLPIGRRGDPQYSGPRPWSEPETRAVHALLRRLRPDVTIWFHQPQGIVRAWGRSIPVARRYARLAAFPYRSLPWPNGTAPNWQNHAGMISFVVELPPGPLPAATAARLASAVRRLTL